MSSPQEPSHPPQPYQPNQPLGGPPPHPAAPPGGAWQPTNPPAPPLPPQKKGRNPFLIGCLGIIGVLFLLGLVGVALSGGSDTASTTSAADATESSESDASTAAPKASSKEEAKPKLPGVGTKVRDGKFEFTVTKVADGGTRIGNEYLNEKAQGRFWRISVSVKNIGDESQLMSDSNQKVKDAKGREFEASSEAGIYIKDNDAWLKEINPGNTLKGTLVFDMPKGTRPETITLHDSAFSDGVVVSLR